MLIIGSISDDIKMETKKLIERDRRIQYLGWKSADELNKYLDAADIYMQPGKVSAIFQNAVCRGCAIIVNDLVDYRPFINGNGWLIQDPQEIEGIMKKIVLGDLNLNTMKEKSFLIAKEQLDYRALAKCIES